MNNNSNQLGAIDIISLVGFMIGLANYEQNVDQNTMQDTVQNAVQDIHKHLGIQDTKIDNIINMLGGEKYER